MIVLIIHQYCIITLKGKSKSPITTHLYSPVP